MRSAINDLIQSIPDMVLIGMSIFFGIIFLMWLFLPFAVYGMKRKQKEQIQVLQEIQGQLKQNTFYLARASVEPLSFGKQTEPETDDDDSDTASPARPEHKIEPSLTRTHRDSRA